MLRKPFTFIALAAAAVSASSLSWPGQVHRRGADLTGDSQCGQGLCVSAIINGSEAEYVLTYSGSQKLGWLAMGFGTEMSNAQMVIMWPNANGNVTLSQRKTPGEVMPTVDPNPQRIATFSSALSNIAASKPQFGYTIPVNSDTEQNIIWSYSLTAPSSSAVDATLVQHVNEGQMTLDLTKSLSSSNGSSSSSSSSSSSPSSSSSLIALTPIQAMILGHAVLCSVGFLVFLPTGVLLARYSRFANFTWFTGHWIIQFALSAPIIIPGIILAFRANSGASLPDTHKTLGKVLLGLYLGQCALGAFIHFVKPAIVLRRPPQNYLHGLVGVSIIALAFAQVRLGYRYEWPMYVPDRPVPGAVNIVWWVWVILLPLVYFAGLVTLKKQYKMEQQQRLLKQENNFTMHS